MEKNTLLRNLARRIRDIEAEEHQPRETTGPLVIPGLAEALPQLRAGSLVELLSAAEGAGAWTLALIVAKHACGEKKALVIADSQRCFYPPAAARLGVDLRRTIVIRPKVPAHALSAIVQSLRCPAVGAAVGMFDNLSATHFRRLQLAAETGGGIGCLLRPASALGQPSFAGVRLVVSPALSLEGRRRMQIDVVRFRGSKSGQSFVVEIDDEAGDVHLSASVASAKTLARSARASG